MMLYNTFNKKLLIGFITTIAVITIVTIVAYDTIRSTIKTNGWVSHTHLVIENTQNILSQLKDAGNYKNEYLLSGSQQQYKNYAQSVNTIKEELDFLKNFVADNPPQVRNVDSLKIYALSSLQSMSAVLAEQQGKELGITAKPKAELQNTKLFNCWQIGNTIIANEKKLMVTRKDLSMHKAKIAVWIILSSAAVVIVLLSLLLIFISRTFTSKEKLREQLSLSEGMFAGAFNDSGIGMALVTLEGKLMDVNPYLLQLLGYSKDELLQKTFHEITYPDDLEADLALIDRVLKGEIVTYKLEKRYFHKGGYIVWGALTVSLVHYESGTPRFFVSQIEDITATKNMIQELELKNQVLLQTSAELEYKINQLEEFNRIVAHNLRGPAGGIETMLSIMIEEKDPAEKEEMLRLVLGSSKSLNATLQDLMQILEIRLNQHIEYANCELKETVQTTIQMLQGEILHSKATIHTNFSVTHILFPKVYLESLFYNMISNSLKYKKGEVPVEINISSLQENGKTKLVFEDNGLGIDLNRYGPQMFKLNKVFHKGYDSRGVGLFITKNQLETHGGTISVESTPGIGTKFIVHL